MSKYFVRTPDIKFSDYCFDHGIVYQLVSTDWHCGVANFIYVVDMDEQEVVRLKLATLDHKIMPAGKYYEPLQ
jgi:hypothetical protein